MQQEKLVFRNIVHHFKKQGGILLVSEIQPPVKTILKKNGLFTEIGKVGFFDHTGQAINEGLRHLDTNRCFGCEHFAFRECTRLSQQQDWHKNTIKLEG